MKSIFQKLCSLVGGRAEIARSAPPESAPPDVQQFIIAEQAIQGLELGLRDSHEHRKEKIVYLFGRISGETNLVVTAFKPRARTTYGSFDVSEIAMAEVVRSASKLGLEVVGQAHTHPGKAYHSGGDDDGARIAYPGFLSMVFPDFGNHLPDLRGSANFVCVGRGVFAQLRRGQILVIPNFIGHP